MSTQKISVVGLGQMGLKIAELFVREKYNVTVWNRTLSKAKEVAGAAVAASAAEAFSASDVVIIIVFDNKAVWDIVNNVSDKSIFEGKTVLNLTTGTPEEVNELERFFASVGARYLNGALQVAPDQMGLPETTILLAGEGYSSVVAELAVLGGNAQYLDNKAAASAAMDLASLSWLYGSYVGMLYGVLLVKQAGLNLNKYGDLLAQVTPGFVEFFKHQINTIGQNNFEITQSPLAISITATQRIAEAIRAAGGAPAFHDTIAQLLKKADAAGLGNQELSSLIKIIQ